MAGNVSAGGDDDACDFGFRFDFLEAAAAAAETGAATATARSSSGCWALLFDNSSPTFCEELAFLRPSDHASISAVDGVDSVWGSSPSPSPLPTSPSPIIDKLIPAAASTAIAAASAFCTAVLDRLVFKELLVRFDFIGFGVIIVGGGRSFAVGWTTISGLVSNSIGWSFGSTMGGVGAGDR
jgi:hypothetical protein